MISSTTRNYSCPAASSPAATVSSPTTRPSPSPTAHRSSLVSPPMAVPCVSRLLCTVVSGALALLLLMSREIRCLRVSERGDEAGWLAGSARIGGGFWSHCAGRGRLEDREPGL